MQVPPLGLTYQIKSINILTVLFVGIISNIKSVIYKTAINRNITAATTLTGVVSAPTVTTVRYCFYTLRTLLLSILLFTTTS